MARRAVFAAALLSFAVPALAQRPVYPNFPPPPPTSGDNAPHQDTTPPDQGDQTAPGQQPTQTPDQQRYPPQKPSPYPPSDEQNGPYGQQQPNYPPPSTPSYPAPAPAYPAPGPAYPAPQSWLSWLPQDMEVLARTAAFHTDFTFDRTMLQMVNNMWEGPGDPRLEEAVSRLDGIAVHSYHYAAPGMYDPRLLETVRRQYSAMGWEHLVTARSVQTGGATDLWISFHHMRATGAIVLFQSPTNLNLIAFSGNLSPLDLLHLRGHFGIPRFPGDRFVPAPGGSARVAPRSY
jgi:hypothetical protein